MTSEAPQESSHGAPSTTGPPSAHESQRRHGPRISLWRLIPITLLVLLLGAFGWTLWFLYQKSQEPPIVFETATPFTTNIVKKTVAPGAIVPRQEITVKPRVSGVLEELAVEPGEYVKKDQLIARIKIIPNVVTLNNAEASLRSAEISFQNADKERNRFRELLAEGVSTQTEYNRHELEYQLKRQELVAARNNLQLIQEGASKGSGKVSNEVVSTVEGMVIEVPVKEGASVIETNNFNEGTTIAAVANMNDMIFQGFIDESEIGKLKEDMVVDIRIGAIDEKVFKGTLEYLAPKGVKREGTIEFEIKAAIDLPKGTFVRANYSANADIILDRRKNVLAINEAWIQFEEGKPFVEVEVAPQEFEKRSVELGLSDGIHVEVLGGVTEQDPIKQPEPKDEKKERG